MREEILVKKLQNGDVSVLEELIGIHYQEILILRFGQNLKLREIAEIVGLPMRTVQSKVKAGLKEIERELKVKGGMDR